jgi:cold shock CspA family protein/DNA-directed RNA polymerase subunit L
LLELSQLGDFRPPYYLVKPNVTKEEIRLWDSKRIYVLQGDFKCFLTTLDQLISQPMRVLSTIYNIDHPIKARFRVNAELSKNCLDFLENDVDYVYDGLPTENASPKAFYRGFGLNWYPIVNDLDVKRNLVDTFLNDVILISEYDRHTNTELYLLRAEAGAGKSIFLRRLAWNAAIDAKVLCLYLKEYGHLRYDALTELCRLTQERIFIFVDNAADVVLSIEDIIIKAKKDKLPITIITAERINEWNMLCERIDQYITEKYKLPYLSQKEIKVLVSLLEKHDSLGYLYDYSYEDRIKAFEERAGRQLLVALHEATLGKPFVDILVNEYNEIKPQLAQSLYLTVCVLNRLGVIVRAGLISRIYGVPFTEFKKRLFGPLEHVVQIIPKTTTDDYYYTARHTQIADIVFERILTSPIDRYNEYLKILNNMNISYSTDREAFKRLIRGKALIDLFPDHDTVEDIFKTAHIISNEDSYIYHQQAIYEMNRPNGSLDQANRLLEHAKKLNENDSTIIHSLAELALTRSKISQSSFEKERYRNEAKRLSIALLSESYARQYARHTLLKIYKEQLEEIILSDHPVESEIDSVIQQFESHLEQGLQEFPGDSFFLTEEAKFSDLLTDEQRALKALESAFKSNRRNTYIVNRLAKAYEKKGEISQAIEVVKEALDGNPHDPKLHYRLSVLLRIQNEVDIKILLYHLKRSFNVGDRNYEAQFWYARYLYVTNEREFIDESLKLFRKLREIPILYEERMKIKSTIEENGKLKLFYGTIAKKEDTFGFILCDSIGEQIFIHKNNISSNQWNTFEEHQRVSFNIGFNFCGPVVLNICG